MSCRRYLVPLFLIAYLSAVFLLNYPVQVLATVEDDASSLITEAEQKVAECFKSLAGVDAVGANVISLYSVLNDAGNLLSEANLAYRQGDFSTALELASKCLEKLDGFIEEADSLMVTGIQNNYNDFLFNVVGSFSLTLVILGCGAVIWLLMSRKKSNI